MTVDYKGFIVYVAVLGLLACDAFVKTNRRVTAMMSVRLSVWDGRAL